MQQNEAELRIIKLQKDYKLGNIKEEDMSSEEREKLIDLYKRQNEELKQKIKRDIIRKKIR